MIHAEWSCPFCSNVNWLMRTFCNNDPCHMPRDLGGLHHPSGSWACLQCNLINLPSCTGCIKCDKPHFSYQVPPTFARPHWESSIQDLPEPQWTSQRPQAQVDPPGSSSSEIKTTDNGKESLGDAGDLTVRLTGDRQDLMAPRHDEVEWSNVYILPWEITDNGRLCLGRLRPPQFNGQELYLPEIWEIISSFYTDVYFDGVLSNAHVGDDEINHCVTCSSCGATDLIASSPFIVGYTHTQRYPGAGVYFNPAAYCSEQSMLQDGAFYEDVSAAVEVPEATLEVAEDILEADDEFHWWDTK
jgi:hypothetical protein